MKKILLAPLMFCFGCSMYMTPPTSMPSNAQNSPGGSPSDSECTDSPAAPIADTVVAVGLGTATVAMATSASSQVQYDRMGQEQFTDKGTVLATGAVVAGLGALLYTVSAAHGYKLQSRCSDAKAAQKAWEQVRQEQVKKKFLTDQQQALKDPWFPYCSQAWGQSNCADPNVFSQYKTQLLERERQEKERQAELERENQRQEEKKRAAQAELDLQEKTRQEQERARKTIENCNLFIQYRCKPITSCNTIKECGMRGSEYMCWNNTQCSETGQYSCREEPPSGCVVPGYSGVSSPHSENERGGSSLPLNIFAKPTIDALSSDPIVRAPSSKRGCCSHHHGICSMRGNHAICCDGWTGSSC